MKKILDNTQRAKQAITGVIITMSAYLVIGGAWVLLLQGISKLRSGDFSGASFTYGLAESIPIIAWVTIAIYIINGIVFMHWFRRAYGNLFKYGAPGLKSNESMAVWGWFIPIANFFIPFQIMTEIWKGYNFLLVKINSPISNQNAKLNSINLWWAVSVIGSIASIIGNQLIKHSESLIPGLVFNVIGLGAPIICGVLLVGIMRKVKEMEEEVLDHQDEILAEAKAVHMEKVKIAKAKAAQVQAQAQQRRAAMRPPRK